MSPDQTELSLPKVEVANQYPGLRFNPEKLEKFFESVCSIHHHNLRGDLSVVFMNRGNHSKLHGKFLQDFRPTDVITFPADQENEIAGEICVSVDQALEEARSRNLPLDEELSLYLIHGWLHLVGFDDIEKVDREIMRMEEYRVLEHVKKQNTWPNFHLAPEPNQ